MATTAVFSQFCSRCRRLYTAKMAKRWRLLLLIICGLATQHTSDAQLDVTLVNEYPIIDFLTGPTYLKTVTDHPPQRISFGRETNIGLDYERFNDDLWATREFIFPQLYWPGSMFTLVRIAQDFRIGSFFTELQLDDGGTFRILTVKMSKYAPIKPITMCQRANVGENVTIQMLSQEPVDRGVYWRRNEDLMLGRSTLNLTLNQVTTDSCGVYECYRTNTERNLALQGITRLVVRACPDGKWGPDCGQDCSRCYNGGICDPEDGECICAIGFSGSTCETPCGARKFGQSCQHQCNRPEFNIDGDDACRSYVFCLPDPYGCSCNTGFKGLDCTEACKNGTYGAGCTETCHCLNGVSCNRFTGACPDQCAEGWTKGPYCQHECDPGKFGVDCKKTCHCLHDVPCDRFNGSCPGACAPGWTGPACQVRDYCVSNPCENGGTCVNHDDGYTCNCTTWHLGRHCEILRDACNPNPCRNGGACQILQEEGSTAAENDDEHRCHCVTGYYGLYCERVDHCEPDNPCLHGGACTTDWQSYVCHCPAGFAGVNCADEDPKEQRGFLLSTLGPLLAGAAATAVVVVGGTTGVCYFLKKKNVITPKATSAPAPRPLRQSLRLKMNARMNRLEYDYEYS
ncbi:PREDICTED: multiple epidermal growth factor-like domains protein 6 [Branchiostoma belcheri]|uniref:Multiple epidermal growth factor-like domains protein 6 n=1 Tax=Branchiostoma belcheri TaxID=7741 RepID=A0A6P5AFG2_BRABE|nr:PREDICTED: multiple epidermal growth factor-like domains protein 6 [Branchiostoma belcheri]